MAPAASTSKGSQRQSTLSQHLACAENKRTSASKDRSASKRRKTSHSPDPPSSAARLSLGNMYNFGTKENAIDLTSSPPASPKARRISAATPLATQHGPPQTFGAKRLVVKNLRRQTSTSANSEFCVRTTAELDQAVTAILDHKQPAKSNEELYRGCENLCRMQKASELAKLLDTKFKAHISGPVIQKISSVAADKSVDVLRTFVEAWSTWRKQVATIRSIFYFLDRSYLLQSPDLSIQESATKMFRTQVFGKATMAGKAVDGACQLLALDRTQSTPDQALFKAAIDMFHDLAVYTDEFEPRMLAISQNYIRHWADTECSEKELPVYVEACFKFIKTEMARCDGFDLDSTTRRELLTLLEHNLIERKEAELTDQDSIAKLLDTDDTAALGSTFNLLQKRRLGEKLKGPFCNWIDLTGTGIIFDEKGQDQMVVRLLELKQKLDKIWRAAFDKNRAIGHSLREAFEAFINKSKKTSATWGTDNSKPGEMVAKYIDSILRGGSKAIPKQLSNAVSKQHTLTKAGAEDDEDEEVIAGDQDAEVENQLDQVLDLFRFIHGKAVFEAFYKKDLARRLLMSRSASNDAEKSMLNRLQAECGSSFTHNLEQMFRDVEVAQNEMDGYKQRLQTISDAPEVDVNVNILSAAAWPTYPDVPCTIPPEIQQAIAHFEAYYGSKHTGRKLAWKHALAHCQMRARFSKGVKEIVVSSFQAIILLLFNNLAPGEHLSYERIKAESGLDEAEVKRTLQSLACAKLRPLTKNPKGREINDDDTFTVNDGFTHERYRVKINTIQMKETAEENKETHERVAADRQYETQAAIVRILKARKEISHAELISETIKATRSRGVLQPAEIKRQIERLIDKEYAERLEGNRYMYLA